MFICFHFAIANNTTLNTLTLHLCITVGLSSSDKFLKVGMMYQRICMFYILIDIAKLPYKNGTVCSTINILWYCTLYHIFANNGFYQKYHDKSDREMLSWLHFHFFDLQGVWTFFIFLLVNFLFISFAYIALVLSY